MARSATVWLRCTEDNDYIIDRNGGQFVHQMCKELEWVTGFQLPPGSKQRVKISIEPVGKLIGPPPRKMIMADLIPMNMSAFETYREAHATEWPRPYPAITTKAGLFHALYSGGPASLRQFQSRMVRELATRPMVTLDFEARRRGTITGRSPSFMVHDEIVHTDTPALERRIAVNNALPRYAAVLYGRAYDPSIPEEGEW